MGLSILNFIKQLSRYIEFVTVVTILVSNSEAFLSYPIYACVFSSVSRAILRPLGRRENLNEGSSMSLI